MFGQPLPGATFDDMVDGALAHTIPLSQFSLTDILGIVNRHYVFFGQAIADIPGPFLNCHAGINS